jgi:hypothetical protein
MTPNPTSYRRKCVFISYLSLCCSQDSQLDEATASLTSRDASIADLESQVADAKNSLDSALADLDTKRSVLEELEQAKSETEAKLKDARENLQVIKAEREGDKSASILEAVQIEVIMSD